jgi:hypothetical protein
LRLIGDILQGIDTLTKKTSRAQTEISQDAGLLVQILHTIVCSTCEPVAGHVSHPISIDCRFVRVVRSEDSAAAPSAPMPLQDEARQAFNETLVLVVGSVEN